MISSCFLFLATEWMQLKITDLESFPAVVRLKTRAQNMEEEEEHEGRKLSFITRQLLPSWEHFTNDEKRIHFYKNEIDPFMRTNPNNKIMS